MSQGARTRLDLRRIERLRQQHDAYQDLLETVQRALRPWQPQYYRAPRHDRGGLHAWVHRDTRVVSWMEPGINPNQEAECALRAAVSAAAETGATAARPRVLLGDSSQALDALVALGGHASLAEWKRAAFPDIEPGSRRFGKAVWQLTLARLVTVNRNLATVIPRLEGEPK